MTASSLPYTTKPPLSINVKGCVKDLTSLRNKGRTNYTAACFYQSDELEILSCPKSKDTHSGKDSHMNMATTGTNDPLKISNNTTGTSPDGVRNNVLLASPQSVVYSSHCSPATASVNATPDAAPSTTQYISPNMCQSNTNNNSIDNPPITKSSPSRSLHTVTPVPNSTHVQVKKVATNYDMNLVPKVKKNPAFLKSWRDVRNLLTEFSNKRDINLTSSQSSFSLPGLVSCDASFGESDAGSIACHEKHDSHNSPGQHFHSSDKESRPNAPCHTCHQTQQIDPNSTAIAEPASPLSPFPSDFESVIWVPNTIHQWEDCIDEMVAVCTAAAWHKFRAGKHMRKKKDFHAPISKLYIDERVKIDDPLRGYQIRHKTGGWLQGFVTMTTFTVWTHYFKWDTSHSANGIDQNKPHGRVDDGSLASELERQTRSGDPLSEGVVWPTVAEMSLVGALGCGEYLLQMALDNIARTGTYEYVVLEATESSRPFYEKFGFVRVGAICKYGKEQDVTSENQDIEVVGYRHWTYPESTVENLSEHGSPSCMMARRVIPRSSQSVGEDCTDCGTKIRPSFLDELAPYFVNEKPRIERLGCATRKRPMSSVTSPTTKAMKLTKTSTPSRVTSSGRKSKAPSRLDETVELYRPRKTPATRTSRNSSSPTVSLTNSLAIKQKGKNNKPILLRKQKIPSMYRSPKNVYYYNKVVTPKFNNKKEYKSKYYFVINYDIEAREIRAIPLFLRGSFKGKREGRPKWKAIVLPREDKSNERSYLETMNVVTSPCSDWNIVQSYAVTKCASVQEESWDVLV